MKLEQLNEFNLFKKSKKTIPYTVKDFNITLKLDNIVIKIGYLKEEYRIIVKANVFNTTIKDTNLKSGLTSAINFINDLKTTAKNGKTETAPVDLPNISIEDFDITKMEQDLK